MHLLDQFISYLSSQKKQPSRATLKNYKADLNKFLSWYKTTGNGDFEPHNLTLEVIESYKTHLISTDSRTDVRGSSPRSVERYISSLRKFSQFLKLNSLIGSNPFDQIRENQIKDQRESDPFHLKDFKDYLYVYNASRLTIKNYINDIKQYLSSGEFTLSTLNANTIASYKQELIRKNISPSSINRKLSSLRKYLTWAQSEGLITQKQEEIGVVSRMVSHSSALDSNQPVISAQSEPSTDSISLPNMPSQTISENLSQNDIDTSIENLIGTTAARLDSISAKRVGKYSKFPPLRLLQKLAKGIDHIFEHTLVIPVAHAARHSRYLFWKLTGGKIFKNQQNTLNSVVSRLAQHSSAIKASLNVAPVLAADAQLHHRLLFHAKYTRPDWYKKYHTYPIVHYFHLAVLVIFMSIVGFALYQSFFGDNQKAALATGAQPLRILSFQGRLTDASDNPITTPKQLRFIVYNSSSASSSARLWEEVDTVSPDNDGIFSIYLGSDGAGGNATLCNGGSPPVSPATGACGIPQSLFADNSQLWLGVTVQSDTELAPRQQLANVPYATNAETLQGLPPITQSGAGTTNVVLALNSSGNLSIGGSATPIFEATAGSFTVRGTTTIISTTAGSNGSVYISPDGSGRIDLQKPLVNTSLSNNIPSAAGAVEVDDLFAILASSSGQSAFTINQTGGGPLISASASGSPIFTVANSGALTDAAYTNAGGILYTSTTGLIGQTTAGTSSQCLLGGTTPAFGSCSTGVTTDLYWSQTSGALYPNNSTVDFLVGGQSSTSAKFKVLNIATGTPTASISANSGNNATFISGTGNLATTNMQTLTIGGSTTGDIVINARNGSGKVTFGTSPGIIITQAEIQGADGNIMTIGRTAASTTMYGNWNLSPDGGTPYTMQFGSSNGTLTLGGVARTNAQNGIVFTPVATGSTPTISTNGSSDGVVNLAIIPKGGGNLGIGTTSPLGTLHLTGVAGGNATAIFNTGNATNDLFTASSSGTTKFTIANSGALTDAAYTNVGGILYTSTTGLIGQTSAGTNVQCLLGGTTPTFGSCATGTTDSYWSQANGALYPNNTTVDFFIGGQATTSAKFAVLNVNSGTTTASVAGNFSLGSAGGTTRTIGATNKNNLQLGDTTTGGLIFSPNNSEAMRINISGNVGVGTNNPIRQFQTTGDFAWGTSGSKYMYTVSGTQILFFTSAGTNILYSGGAGGLGFNDAADSTRLMQLTNTGNLGIQDSTPDSPLEILNANPSQFRISYIDGTDSQFTVDSSGNLTIDNTGTKTVVSDALQVNGNVAIGTTSTTGALADIYGTGGVYGTNLKQMLRLTNSDAAATNNGVNIDFSAIRTGGQITPVASISAIITNIGSTTYTGTLAFSTAGTAAIPTEKMRIQGDGNVGIGTTAPSSNLVVYSGASGATPFSTSKLVIENSNHAGIAILTPNTSTGSLYFGDPQSNFSGGFEYDHSTDKLSFYNNAAIIATMRTASSSNLGQTPILELHNNTATVGQVSEIALGYRGGSYTFSHSTIGDIMTDNSGFTNGALYFATRSLTTDTAPLERMRIDSNGNVAIGTTSPIGVLHVRGIAGGNATAIFDTRNATNDLFTASSSGTTKFTIGNSGALTDAAYTNAGGILYTSTTGLIGQTTAGTNVQCLLGGTTPSFGSCATGTADAYWAQTNGALFPNNSTVDFFIGGQATTSAKFAVLNVNSGTPTASISANSGNIASYHTGDGTIATTNRQTLTIGNSATYNTTGNIVLQSNGQGNVGIGTTNPGSKFNVFGGGTGVKSVVIRGNTSNDGNILELQNTSGTLLSTFDSAGALGLGIQPGTYPLDILTNTSQPGTLYNLARLARTQTGSVTGAYVTFAGGASGTTARGYIGYGSTGGGVTDFNDEITNSMFLAAVGALQLGSNAAPGGNSTMTLSTGGNVGIGTNAPGVLTDIYGSGGVFSTTPKTLLRLVNSDSAATNNGVNIDLSALRTGGQVTPLASISGILTNNGSTTYTGALAFSTAGTAAIPTEKMRIQGDGNVGIGISSVATKFQVNLASNKNVNINIATDPIIQFLTDNAGAYIAGKIDSSSLAINSNSGGNVGIRMTSPGSALVVQGQTADNTRSAFNVTDTNALSLFYVRNDGFIGIGTTSPLALLHISGIAGGNATAIFNTGNATNDLFTASSSGTTKFTIANSGAITDAAYTNAGGILYTSTTGLIGQTAIGTAAQCLIGGTTPSFTTCPGGTDPYWSQTNGALYPNNSTVDFLIGGQSSTSAKFKVLNIAAGTPTASISANSGNIATYITGDGTLATTNRQSLTIGNSATYNTTGNVLINSNGQGNVGIGTTNPTNLLEIAKAGPDTHLVVTESSDSGSGTAIDIRRSRGTSLSSPTALQASNFMGAINFQGYGTSYATGAQIQAISSQIWTASANGTNLTLSTVPNNSTTVTERMRIQQDGNVGINSTSPGTTLDITGTLRASSTITFSTFTSNGGVLYTNGSGVLAQATAGTAAQCLVGGTTPTFASCPGGTDPYWSQTLGALYPNNSSVDFFVGGQATTSAKFAVLNVNSGTPTASVSAGTAGGAFLTSTGFLSTTARQGITIGNSATFNTSGNTLINPNGTGNLGVGTTNPVNLVHVSGTVSGTDVASFRASSTTTNLSSDFGNIVLVNSNTTNNNYASLYFASPGSGDTGTTIRYGSAIQAVFTTHNASSVDSDLVFRTTLSGSGSEKVRITGAGNVGIGTSVPLAVADIQGTGGVYGTNLATILRLANFSTASTNNGINVDFSANRTGGQLTPVASISGIMTNTGSTTYTGALAFSTAGTAAIPTERMRIDSNGNVGIGSSAPVNKTDIIAGSLADGVSSLRATGTLPSSHAGQVYGVLFDITSAGSTGQPQSAVRGVLEAGYTGSHQTRAGIFENYAAGTGTSPLISGTTANFGVYGYTSSVTVGNNVALFGQANSSSVLNYGVIGRANESTSSPTNNVAVLGSALNATNSVGGYFLLGTATPTFTTAALIADNGAQAAPIFIGRDNGTAVFTVGDGGSLTATTFTSNGGPLYTNGSGAFAQVTAGTTSQCLIGGTTPTFGSCATGETIDVFWNQTNGALYPNNSTVDFFVGGQATTSAKFAVLNVNSGTTTASVAGNFSLGSAGGTTRTIGATNKNNLQFGDATTGGLIFSPNNSEAMRIVVGGNVGIANSNPLAKLHVGAGADAISVGDATSQMGYFTAAGQTDLIVRDSTNDIEARFTTTPNTSFLGASGVIIGATTNHALGLLTNSTVKLTILTGGNVGIGTTSPGALAEVYGSGGIYGTNLKQLLRLVNSDTAATNNGVNIDFSALRTGGQITPLASISAILTTAGSATYNGALAFSTAGTAAIPTERMRIDSAGNVGIGTSLPTNAKLEIAGGSVLIDNSQAYQTKQNSGTVRSILQVNSSDVMLLGSTAFVIYSQNDIGANTDGSADLGPTSHRFRDLNLSRNLAAAGNVGAGTTTPAAPGDIQGDGGAYGTNLTDILRLTNTRAAANTNAANITFSNNRSGGVQTPVASISGIIINTSPTGYSGALAFSVANTAAIPTEAMRIVGSGNVGIGNTTATGATLDITGSLKATSTITFSTFTSNGGVLYTNGSGILAQATAGTSSQCLVGGTTPAFTACNTGPNDYYWSQGSGALFANNSTVDLLVGGQATTSAKFAVLNVNSGTPTASISANSGNIATYLTGDGTLATTNRQTLTIGNSSTYNTTGNVVINPNGTGSVGIGTTSFSSPQNAKLAINTSATEHGLSVQNTGTNVGASIVYALAPNSTTTATNLFRANSNSTDRFIVYGDGTAYLQGNVAIGTTTTSNGLLTVGASGTRGTIRIEGTSAAEPAISFVSNETNGRNYIIYNGASVNSNFDIMDSTQGSYRLSIDASGNVGIGTITPKGTLHVSGIAAGNATAIINAGNATNDIFTASSSGTPRFVITNAGNVGIGSTLPAQVLDVVGNFQLTGTTTFNTQTYTWPSGGQSSGFVLSTNGSGTLTWVDPTAAAAGANYWTQANGALFPKNSTVDFFVGGQATSSAKFAVLNLNSGTPVASVSSGTNGTGSYHTADGTFATTSRQALTIGNSATYNTTGNVLINPNGTGNVGIGTTTTPSLFTVGTSGGFQVNSTGAITAPTSTNTINSLVINAGALSGITTLSSTYLVTTTNNVNLAGASTVLQMNGTTIVDASRNISNIVNFTSTGTTTFNTQTYTWPSGGQSLGYVLSTNGSGTLSWTDVSAVSGVNYWMQANGTLFPRNSTVDLLIGGQATSSAKFAVLNVNSGTPVASVSSGTNGTGSYLTADGTLAATNRQSLILGNSSTYNTTGTIFMQQNGTGNVAIGTTTAPAARLLVASATEQLRLGFDATNISSFTVDSSGNLTIDNNGTKTVVADDLQVTGNDILDSGATSRITLGATTTLTNTTTTLSGTSTLTASSLATFTTAASLSMGSTTTLTLGASPTLTNASGNLTLDSNGNTLVLAASDTTLTASGLATFTTAASLAMSSTTTLTLGSNATINGGSAANDDLTLQGTSNATRLTSYVLLQPTAGNVAIGTTAPIGILHIQGIAGGNATAIFDTRNATNDLFTASSSGTTKFTIANSGALTDAAYTNAGGILYTSTTGLIGQTAIGTATQCLLGGTTPSFGSCTSTNIDTFWSQANGALFPNNSTVDFFVGGQATTSAKFAVLNINSGTPVASVSSGLNGTASYHTADGTFATTNRMSLTIGNSATYNTTGNVLINSNGTGNLGIGTTYPATFVQAIKNSVGGTVIMDLENTDNTNGSSNARISVAAGGASGGDPSLLLTIPGATDWSIGVDNSDSDKLKIGNSTAIGTNTLLTIQSTDGNVGIGTSSPANFKFQVAGNIGPDADNTYDLGSSPSARFRNLYLGPGSLHIQCTTGDGCGGGGKDWEMGVITAGNAKNTFMIGVNGGPSNNRNPVFAISEGGNVGIASQSALSDRLIVNGNVQAQQFKDYDNNLYFLDPAATATSLAVAGNVGIGTTTAGAPLDIQMSGGVLGTNLKNIMRLINNDSTATNNGVNIELSTLRTGGQITPLASISAIMTNNGSTTYTGALTFSTADTAVIPTERMRIDGEGLVSIGTTSSSGMELAVAGNIGPSTGPATQSASLTKTTVNTSTSTSAGISMAIGTDSKPILAYGSQSTGDNKFLVVTKCGNSACSSGNTTTTVNSSADASGFKSTNITDRGFAMIVGTDGMPVIAYGSITPGNSKMLVVTHCGDATCSTANATTTTVDSTAKSSNAFGMALGADGFPIIAYGANDNTGLLKTVHCTNATCSTHDTATVIDSTAHASAAFGVVIGTDSIPIIVYTDISTGNIKTVKCTSVTCLAPATTTIVYAGGGDAKGSPSIALGSDGFPVIAHSISSTGQLSVIHCSTASCSSSTTTVLDATTNNANPSSIAISLDGLPFITYAPQTTSAFLKTAKCTTITCSAATTTLVDSATDIAVGTATAIGTDGLPFIAYGSTTAGNGKFATTAKCATTDCSGTSGSFSALASLGPQLGAWMANASSYSVPYQTLNTLQIANPTTFQNLSFLTGGSTRMVVDPVGNVGIGTTVPGALLQVGSSASGTHDYIFIDAANGFQAGLQFNNAGTAKSIIYRPASSNDLRFWTSVVGDSMTLQNSSGNIGIATTAPAAKLHIQAPLSLPNASGSTSTDTGLRMTNASGGGTGGTMDFGQDGATGSWIQSRNAGDYTTNYPLLLNPNGGNVGIGSTAAVSSTPRLFVNNAGSASTTQGIQLMNNAADTTSTGVDIRFVSSANWLAQIAAVRDTAVGSYMTLSTLNNGTGGFTEVMRMVSPGNVGIGTTSTSRRLEVAGAVKAWSDAGANNFILANTSGTDKWYMYLSGNDMRFYDTADRFTFQSGGNLGIGSTSPDGGLNIDGTRAWTSATWYKGMRMNGINAIELGGGGTTMWGQGVSANVLYGFSTTTETSSGGAPSYWEQVTSAGNVGMDVYLNISTTANTTAICHANNTGLHLLTDCNGSATDLAEVYKTDDTSIEAADVVSITGEATNVLDPFEHKASTKASIEKSSQPYQSNIAGVVSTNPNQVYGAELYNPSENPHPVSLAGRIPVKVSTENGPIVPGDFLTSSSTPGVAMKSTKAGQVIGMAMQSYDADGVGKVIVLVKPTWHDPDAYLADTGNMVIAQQPGQIQYQISKDGVPITRVGAFASAAIANVQAGIVQSQKIIADSVQINADSVSVAGQSLKDYIVSAVQTAINNGQLTVTSPISSVDQVHTNVISPLASNAVTINGDLGVNGNATVSGTLRANQLAISGNLTAADATISGVLRVKHLIADDIEGLNINTATLAATTINNITNVYQSTSSAGTASNSGVIASGSEAISGYSLNSSAINTDFANISTMSGLFANVNNFSAEFGQFNQGLIALGPTSVTDISASGQLTVGGTMTLVDNSINTLGTDLELQPLRQGAVSFLSGLVRIDENGNMSVEGNAAFAHDVTVKGTLAVGIISPVPGEDLIVNLPATPAGGANLVIKNASGSAIFRLDQIGNLIASGSATIAKLNLNVVHDAIATSQIDAIASGSAGVATISAQQKELTIHNPQVTDKSLIYITPVGTPSAGTPFLLRQVGGQSFSIGIPAASLKDTMFNWLIVN